MGFFVRRGVGGGGIGEGMMFNSGGLVGGRLYVIRCNVEQRKHGTREMSLREASVYT